MSILMDFFHAVPHTFMEVLQALAPLFAVFVFFQFTVLRLRRKVFLKICIGFIYTFLGLLLFLIGINVGFMPAGSELGHLLSGKSTALLIVIGFVLGFVVVMAEPAVLVLNEQVSVVSGGNIGKRSMLYALSIGVGIAIAISMIRIVYDFSIWWYIIPGYVASFILMKFSPNVFTAIAFDSGGVASGPMTATFILAFALGAADSLGVDVMKNAFGTVAMVAMTPLITIQVMGIIYSRRTKAIEEDYSELQHELDIIEDEIELYDDDAEIEPEQAGFEAVQEVFDEVQEAADIKQNMEMSHINETDQSTEGEINE